MVVVVVLPKMKFPNVTLVQLAQHFEVSTNTIRDWMRKGMPYKAKGRSGQAYTFWLPHVVNWRMQYLLEEHRRQGACRSCGRWG